MSKNETVQKKAMTTGQAKEFISAIVQSIPGDLSGEAAQYWIENKGYLQDQLHMFFLPSVIQRKLKEADFYLLKSWENFYKEVFGMDTQLKNLKVDYLQHSPLYHLVIIPKGLYVGQVMNKYNEVMPEPYTLSEIVENFDEVTETYGKCMYYSIVGNSGIENRLAHLQFRPPLIIEELLYNLWCYTINSRGPEKDLFLRVLK